MSKIFVVGENVRLNYFLLLFLRADPNKLGLKDDP